MVEMPTNNHIPGHSLAHIVHGQQSHCHPRQGLHFHAFKNELHLYINNFKHPFSSEISKVSIMYNLRPAGGL